MRALVQRVTKADVKVDDRIVGAIGQGVVVLLGVRVGDSEEDVRFLAKKTAELRIFRDEGGKMNRSLLDTGGQALVISQFTLYADTRKGRRPSYIKAAPPEVANALYEKYVKALSEHGIHVQTGQFQAMMQVSLINDGPVTLILDSDQKVVKE